MFLVPLWKEFELFHSKNKKSTRHIFSSRRNLYGFDSRSLCRTNPNSRFQSEIPPLWCKCPRLGSRGRSSDAHGEVEEEAAPAGMPTHLICNYISVYDDEGDLRRRNIHSLWRSTISSCKLMMSRRWPAGNSGWRTNIDRKRLGWICDTLGTSETRRYLT